MDELEYQRMRLKRKHLVQSYSTSKKPKDTNSLKNVFTRFLLAIIFILGSAIYIHWSSDNLENYRKVMFETNLSFTSINQWYEKYFGRVLPIDLDTNTLAVNKNANDFRNIQTYQNGFRVETTKDGIINTINSGIVVFMGEKEGYGYVVIIQGIDGVDIWYGNLSNVNLSLYDYVEKGTLLGSAFEDHIYLVLQKDGQYLDYEEYSQEI